jgi:hypothetical protein
MDKIIKADMWQNAGLLIWHIQKKLDMPNVEEAEELFFSALSSELVEKAVFACISGEFEEREKIELFRLQTKYA